MNKQINSLILYTDPSSESILYRMAEIYAQLLNNEIPQLQKVSSVYTQIQRLLVLSTEYGFDRNLWQNYLTHYLVMHENPFSLTCEKIGAHTGSVNAFAKNDFRVFIQLFHFDFTAIEMQLDVSCFTEITRYQSIRKQERMYNKNVSEQIQALSMRLAEAKDEQEFFNVLTNFYREVGVGIIGLNKAFRVQSCDGGQFILQPIHNLEQVMLDDLIGYNFQKQVLLENTDAFVQGRKANNVLLFGDSGTGKSTSIKAIINAYAAQGLRMIEIYKHQFRDLSAIISSIKRRNYKFIIYMDDLSFEEFEIEYKYLKAVIEGGMETKPDNVLIYATSNRRHLIRETWKDRNDLETDADIHRSDTMEEKLSLVHRFGCTIFYGKPNRNEYFHIVFGLAERSGLQMTEDQLRAEASKWEMYHGGLSGRTAQQFINDCLTKQNLSS